LKSFCGNFSVCCALISFDGRELGGRERRQREAALLGTNGHPLAFQVERHFDGLPAERGRCQAACARERDLTVTLDFYLGRGDEFDFEVRRRH